MDKIIKQTAEIKTLFPLQEPTKFDINFQLCQAELALEIYLTSHKIHPKALN